MDFYVLHRTEHLDEATKAKVERRVMAIQDCEIPEIQDSMSEIYRVAKDAVVYNSAGWFFYLIPVLLTLLLIGKIGKSIIRMINIPTHQIKKIIPASDAEFSVA